MIEKLSSHVKQVAIVVGSFIALSGTIFGFWDSIVERFGGEAPLPFEIISATIQNDPVLLGESASVIVDNCSDGGLILNLSIIWHSQDTGRRFEDKLPETPTVEGCAEDNILVPMLDGVTPGNWILKFQAIIEDNGVGGDFVETDVFEVIDNDNSNDATDRPTERSRPGQGRRRN